MYQSLNCCFKVLITVKNIDKVNNTINTINTIHLRTQFIARTAENLMAISIAKFLFTYLVE